MVRILVLANSDIGLYKFRRELIETLCKEYEVYIVLPSGDLIEPLKQLGCKFVPFEFNRRGKNPFADLHQIKRYLKIFKELKPDLVLTYTIKPNVYGGIACRIMRIPYIPNITGLGTSIENGGFVSFVSRFLYKIGLKGAHCVFFQNKNNQKLFLEKKIFKGRTKLIPGSGVNLSTNCAEPYPDDHDGIRFLFVGRIMRDKGIVELLEAMELIHQKYLNVSFDLVGFCEEDFSKQLEEVEKEDYVRYHGLQLDVHPFYANCHCTILPSYHEGTANVMLEASATARPVITTRVPGCVETFDEGITGFGCDAKSSSSLVEAIEKFLSLSFDEKRKMGLAARNKMTQEYDRRIVINAYLDEIKDITKSIDGGKE